MCVCIWGVCGCVGCVSLRIVWKRGTDGEGEAQNSKQEEEENSGYLSVGQSVFCHKKFTTVYPTIPIPIQSIFCQKKFTAHQTALSRLAPLQGADFFSTAIYKCWSCQTLNLIFITDKTARQTFHRSFYSFQFVLNLCDAGQVPTQSGSPIQGLKSGRDPVKDRPGLNLSNTQRIVDTLRSSDRCQTRGLRAAWLCQMSVFCVRGKDCVLLCSCQYKQDEWPVLLSKPAPGWH